MNKRKLYFLCPLFVVALLTGFFLECTRAATAPKTAKSYYKGRTIVIVVPTSAGGGADMWARMISTHLGKFVPGNPSVVVKNITGAGQTVGVSHVWAAKPDGLTCLVTAGGNIWTNIFQVKGIDFKLEEMPAIYGTPYGSVLYCKSGLIKEPKDIVTAKGLIWGHDAPVGGTSTTFIWARELLGFECQKMIFGYAGAAPARLAFLSGETNFSGESTVGYLSSVKPYVNKGEVVPVFQVGIFDTKGNVVREGGISDILTVPEVYQQIYGKAPSGPIWEIYKLVVGARTYSKAVLLPKGTPSEVLGILRKAFVEMVKDSKFLDEAEKLNPGAPHFFGEGFARAYSGAVTAPPETLNYMKRILTEKYGVVFD